MADAFLHIMQAPRRGNLGAQLLRRICLAHSRNIVLFTLHRENRRPMDRVQVDHRAAVTVQPQRNRVLDEHFFHGLEIELRRQVHHREIFVVEVAVSFGAIAVAFHEMVEHLEMRGDVAFDVHGHEARQLQKAGIDLAPHARIGKGHGVDAVLLEPADAALL